MQVHIIDDRNLVVFPWKDAASTVLPDSKQVQLKGRKYGAVQHGAVETKLLRNLGYEVPAPILTQYEWPAPPYDSQKVTAALLTTEQRAYCLSSMGVGKTRAALYAYDFLRQVGAVSKMLVVAPLSTLVDVWDREIFECFPHLTSVVLHGTKKQRQKALLQDADVYIINHDGVGVVFDELHEMAPSVIVMDEFAVYRNAQTNRWKTMNRLVNRTDRGAPRFAWGATGGPTPNDPTDAFGQVKLLTPGRVPRSMRAFRQQTMTQITQFKWIAKPEAKDIVHQAMQPSVRYTLDECHDIPQTTYSMRHVPLSSKQALVYHMLLKQFRAQWDGNDILAVNEGAKLAKLLQVSAGFAYDEDGEGIYLDASERVKEVLNVIEQADHKVLVFASYKWMVRGLHKVISKKFPAAMITGDTPKKERDQIFAAFRRSSDPHVIVAHPGTMAHGLTLIEADTIIWYGPTLSNEIVTQANARIRRAGQTKKTHVVCIESTPVERQAYKRLQSNQQMQGLLLELFEGVNEE